MHIADVQAFYPFYDLFFGADRGSPFAEDAVIWGGAQIL